MTTQVIAPDNIAMLVVEHRSPYVLQPHPDAVAIPMSKEDEQALREGIARDGIKTPLHITPDGFILDGVHRWLFAKELRIPRLPVIVYQYTEPEEESLHAIKANLERRQLNEGQRVGLALKILPLEQELARKRMSQAGSEGARKQQGVSTDSAISTNDTAGVLPVGSTPSPEKEVEKGEAAEKAAKVTGISSRTLYRGKKVQEQSPELYEQMTKGDISVTKAYKQVKDEEKAQEVKQLLQEERPLTDLELITKLGIPIQPYDVWSFPQCDDRFGHDYPGRIPGQLVAHCLYFWTEQGDTVLDPMAGSGTTIDVCKVLNRYVLPYDAHPCRKDITLHNLAEQGWPEQTAKAKFIFWDPPYFKKVDNRYGEKSISRLSRLDYLAFFERMAATIPDDFHGYMAFLMSDYNDEENPAESIWLTDYINLFTKQRWLIERIIHTPLSTQQIHPDIVKKFRESKRLARLGRLLVVMHK